jgi:hypothetical protein
MTEFLVPYNCYQVHDIYFKTIQPFETQIITKRYLFLPHCKKKRVAGSIPDRFIGIFHWINPSGRSMELDSFSYINKYQNFLLRVKAARAYGWQTYHLHVPIVYKLWQPQPPGALGACPGLYRDSFNFLLRERSGKWVVLCKYCTFQKLHRNTSAMRTIIFSWGRRTTS